MLLSSKLIDAQGFAYASSDDAANIFSPSERDEFFQIDKNTQPVQPKGLSEKGYTFLKIYETYVQVGKPDIGGNVTWGYGFKDDDGKIAGIVSLAPYKQSKNGMPERAADSILHLVVSKKYQEDVFKLFAHDSIVFLQQEFDALTILDYNYPLKRNYKVIQAISKRAPRSEICEGWMLFRYGYVTGTKQKITISGLIHRRDDEFDIYSKGIYLKKPRTKRNGICQCDLCKKYQATKL